MEGEGATFGPIPDYETPEQYQERTGEPLRDDAAVWFKDPAFPWKLGKYYNAKYSDFPSPERTIIIANVSNGNPPPEEYRKAINISSCLFV
jgi:hypothetical protein